MAYFTRLVNPPNWGAGPLAGALNAGQQASSNLTTTPPAAPAATTTPAAAAAAAPAPTTGGTVNQPQQSPQSSGGGSPGGGGDGGAGYNPFGYDPTIASAMALASQPADQIQQGYAQQSPQISRMSQPTLTSQAPMPQQGAMSDVWVTVPVDKVSVAGGTGTVRPLYAAGQGYQDPGTLIPPVAAAGRP